MKITDIKAYALRIPLKRGDLPAPTHQAVTPVIVKVSTDEGIIGVGEAWGLSNCALVTAKQVEVLAPMLKGRDPTQIQKVWEELYQVTYYHGRAGIALAAISGIEMALWDIAGKAMNRPVYELLGGRAHDKLRAYASLRSYPEAKDAAQACAIIVEKGYTAVKLHEKSVAMVAASREVIGDAIDLLLDVNCAWTTTKAIEMGRQLEPFHLYWFEEPVWPGDDYDGLAEVRRVVNIPVTAGENEYTARGFKGLISKRAVDVLQPGVYKVGGILQVKKVFTLAETFGIRVVPNCWSLGPAMAATVHISFSEPSCELIETAVDTPEANILREAPAPEAGFWKVPDKPGLGIELDEDVVARYSIP